MLQEIMLFSVLGTLVLFLILTYYNKENYKHVRSYNSRSKTRNDRSNMRRRKLNNRDLRSKNLY